MSSEQPVVDQQDLIIQETRPVSKARLLVILLAGLANAIGIPSGAAILNGTFSNRDHAVSRECVEHLLDTEENGIRQLLMECNNEYRILINRLKQHISADQEILRSIEEDNGRE